MEQLLAHRPTECVLSQLTSWAFRSTEKLLSAVIKHYATHVADTVDNPLI